MHPKVHYAIPRVSTCKRHACFILSSSSSFESSWMRASWICASCATRVCFKAQHKSASSARENDRQKRGWTAGRGHLPLFSQNGFDSRRRAVDARWRRLRSRIIKARTLRHTSGRSSRQRGCACRAVPWGESGGGEGRCVTAERCVTPCTELTWDGVDGFIRRTTCGELVRSPWNPLAYAASYTDFASAASIVRRSPAAVALAGWPGGSSGGIRRAGEP